MSLVKHVCNGMLPFRLFICLFYYNYLSYNWCMFCPTVRIYIVFCSVKCLPVSWKYQLLLIWSIQKSAFSIILLTLAYPFPCHSKSFHILIKLSLENRQTHCSVYLPISRSMYVSIFKCQVFH